MKRGDFVTRLCHTEYASEKKAQLENSLMNLMMTRQYQDIRVTDICREAGIPRRTFYHYFDSKGAVLDAVIETMMQQCFMNVMFDFRLGQEHMKNRFLQIFKFWEGENRKKLDVLIHNNLETTLIAWAYKWIRKEQLGVLQNSALLDPKLEEIVLKIGTTEFFALLFHWSEGGYQETPEEMAKYAVWVLPQALFKI